MTIGCTTTGCGCGGLYGWGTKLSGRLTGGGSTNSTSVSGVSCGSSGIGMKIAAPHFGHVALFPAALSGAPNLPPHDWQETVIGIARSPCGTGSGYRLGPDAAGGGACCWLDEFDESATTTQRKTKTKITSKQPPKNFLRSDMPLAAAAADDAAAAPPPPAFIKTWGV
jgi:hypothetical protein